MRIVDKLRREKNLSSWKREPDLYRTTGIIRELATKDGKTFPLAKIVSESNPQHFLNGGSWIVLGYAPKVLDMIFGPDPARKLKGAYVEVIVDQLWRNPIATVLALKEDIVNATEAAGGARDTILATIAGGIDIQQEPTKPPVYGFGL